MAGQTEAVAFVRISAKIVHPAETLEEGRSVTECPAYRGIDEAAVVE